MSDAPWWSYREKDAWFDFKSAEPEIARIIEKLYIVMVYDTARRSTDPVLSSGIQFEAKCLRIATLLGLCDFNWTTDSTVANLESYGTHAQE